MSNFTHEDFEARELDRTRFDPNYDAGLNEHVNVPKGPGGIRIDNVELRKEFVEVYHTFPEVHQAVTRGATPEAIIVLMAKEIKRLRGRVFELEMIAPRKIQKDDGTWMVWRCPAELVPDVTLRPAPIENETPTEQPL